MPRRVKERGFNLDRLLTQVRIWAVELAATVVFLVWLFRVLMHELGVR